MHGFLCASKHYNYHFKTNRVEVLSTPETMSCSVSLIITSDSAVHSDTSDMSLNNNTTSPVSALTCTSTTAQQSEPKYTSTTSPSLPQLKSTASKTVTSSMDIDHHVEVDMVQTSIETLRWENELSDEEMERIRIEEYKLKRRQRYQQALSLQRNNNEMTKNRGQCIKTH